MAQSDCHVYTRPLCYEFVSTKVYYKNSATPLLERIEDLKNYRMKFKTERQYWYYVVNYIKENILIKLPNLRLAKIYINTFDKNNVIHQFIISVGEFISNLLKRECKMNEMIFIYIQYGHEIKFIGNV